MRTRVRKTKIICTIGPSSESEDTVHALIRAGMNVARLNFSHDTHANHLVRINTIRKVSKACDRPVAIMVDTKGPEIRSGEVKPGSQLRLREGATIVLTTEQVVAEPRDNNILLSVSYSDLPQCVRTGSHIYLADGLIDLQVEEVDATTIRCTICSGGIIGSRKNINVPGVVMPFPIISDKDKNDIGFAVQNKVDFIAASFVRRAADIFAIRRCMGEGAALPRIIAKIENQEGVDNIDEIIHAAYGIMVARGDLGVQLTMEHVPLVQKRLIEKCNDANHPVITATQLLESMTRNPRPTRAEMSDVTNAIFDGTDALMLSAETASGAYPVESVTTLDKLARAVEDSPEFKQHTLQRFSHIGYVLSGSEATARAAYIMARELKAAAIIVPSLRGNSPRLLARFRAPQPIIAVTNSSQVTRHFQLHWGLMPLHATPAADDEEMIRNAIQVARKYNYIHGGDWVVTAAGLPLDSPVPFNTVTSHYLGTIIARGREALGTICEGRARLVPQAVKVVQTTSILSSDIAVVPQLDAAHIPLLTKVCGIISEQRALLTPEEIRSHNATIVMIEQAAGARSRIQEGQQLILNGLDKTIYEQE